MSSPCWTLLSAAIVAGQGATDVLGDLLSRLWQRSPVISLHETRDTAEPPAIPGRFSFLLRGTSGALWVVLELVLFSQEIGHEITREFSTTLGVLSGSLEVVPGALIWLTFFPPAFYRSWIAGGTVVAEEGPAHGG
jgi:hypothetical protein